MLSSKASCNSHGQDSSYFFGWQAYEENPYHKTLKPNGVIQMGLAENQLSFDLMENWLAKNPEALSLSRKGKSVFREMALFQDYHGLPSLKTALCKYMTEVRDNKVKLEAKKLVLTAGATSANEALIFCLADPGQAILVPTPYYPGFDRDLKWRTGVKIIPIHCSSSNGFRITMSALEDAYDRSQKLNLKVKAVLVTNPSNPLGTSLTRDELHHLIDFAVGKRIHLVSDEVYSATVFDSPRFISLLEAASDRPNLRDDGDVLSRIHVVSSLSKDLGLPGFRVGTIYSNDEAVVSAATKMSSFGLMSAQTQFLLSEMLGDEKFTRKYTRENLRRLKKRRERTVVGLRHAGIECLDGNSGLFCWADMRHLLTDVDSFEAENDLWKRILNEVGLNISPGGPCHCQEPGWFRVCFANMDKDTLDVAMRRMQAFVDRKQKLGFGFWRNKPKWVLKLFCNEDEPQR